MATRTGAGPAAAAALCAALASGPGGAAALAAPPEGPGVRTGAGPLAPLLQGPPEGIAGTALAQLLSERAAEAVREAGGDRRWAGLAESFLAAVVAREETEAQPLFDSLRREEGSTGACLTCAVRLWRARVHARPGLGGGRARAASGELSKLSEGLGRGDAAAALSGFFDRTAGAGGDAYGPAAPPAVPPRPGPARTRYVPVDGVDFWIDPVNIERGFIELARRAQKRLDVELMEFDADEHGFRVADALADAARRGVKVRVLVDELFQRKSRLFGPDSAGTGVVTRLRRAGIEVRYSNTLLTGHDLIQRDHRKFMAADGREGVSSGYQPKAQYFPWHDAAVRVTGSKIARRMHAEFDLAWKRAGGRPARVRLPKAPAAGRGTRAAGRGSPAEPPVPFAWARVVATEPDHGTAHRLQRSILAAIRSARRNVYIENAFFTDRLVFKALEEAAKRGLDVRLVASEDNVSRMAGAVTDSYYRELLAAGVRVYERPGMVHAKAVSVDGEWASVGSGNLSPLMEATQRELNLEVLGAQAVRELDRTLFEPDFESSVELRLESLSGRVAPAAVQLAMKAFDAALWSWELASQRLKRGFRSLLRRAGGKG